MDATGLLLLWCVAAVVSTVVSCRIAALASGWRASWAWGFLGPVGWIVAALRGIQIRMDEKARPTMLEPTRAHEPTTSTEPANTTEWPTTGLGRGADERVPVECACGHQMRAFVVKGLSSRISCPKCGAEQVGYADVVSGA
jgi:hypothetical protein